MNKLLIMMVLALTITSCKATNSDKTEQETEGTVSALPSTIVYKTTADYSNLVPVIMNADKSTILSYPSRADLGCNGNFTIPTKLNNGYLLDNRGISTNVAFLTYTYEEYCALESEPTIAELMMNIKDKNPLVELIYCAPRNEFNNIVDDINKLIDNGFEGCKKVKLQ